MSDPDEIVEYERTKRLSQIASLRETRLREREEEDRQIESKTQPAVKSWPEEEIVRPFSDSPDVKLIIATTRKPHSDATYSSFSAQIPEPKSSGIPNLDEPHLRRTIRIPQRKMEIDMGKNKERCQGET
jgi:hypothetical protein